MICWGALHSADVYFVGPPAVPVLVAIWFQPAWSAQIKEKKKLKAVCATYMVLYCCWRIAYMPLGT